MRRGADVNGDGGALLIAAIMHNRASIMQLLVKRGVRIKGDAGRVALWQAMVKEPDCVPLLLKYGADAKGTIPQMISSGGTSNAGNARYLVGVLWLAAHYGRSALFLLLIQAGADVNTHDMETNVLMEAVLHAPQGIPILLEHGALADVMLRTGETPLIMAAIECNRIAVQQLLAHGAKVDAHRPHSHSSLYWARKKHCQEIVSLLGKAHAHNE